MKKGVLSFGDLLVVHLFRNAVYLRPFQLGTDDGEFPKQVHDARVAELVDASDSKSDDGNIVRVRVPPRVHHFALLFGWVLPVTSPEF